MRDYISQNISDVQMKEDTPDLVNKGESDVDQRYICDVVVEYVREEIDVCSYV